jgi:hypothetical protein
MAAMYFRTKIKKLAEEEKCFFFFIRPKEEYAYTTFSCSKSIELPARLVQQIVVPVFMSQKHAAAVPTVRTTTDRQGPKNPETRSQWGEGLILADATLHLPLPQASMASNTCFKHCPYISFSG